MNSKTSRASQRSKKIDNDPARWKIFRDTHEAIIDLETFDIVQKIRQGKKRPTKMGEMPMFSGLLYCADCGSKMSFHRKVDEPAEKHNYICGAYRKSTSLCSMHYIRNVVVEQIVLDNLFQRIYEDNISGKLSDERFMKLSKGYDAEQTDIQREMADLQEIIQQEERQSINVDRFLSIVKKYTHLTELTPETLHEFVDKILVHAPDKSSGKRLQEIEIIYNHIGVFDHSKVTLWKGKAV